ncbi:MAG: ABC transporter permease, partial [Actinomycetota bacterium]
MTTAWYVLRRLALLIVSLIASSALVFLLLRLLPGDLAQAKLGIYGTPEALAQLRAEYGLDQSLPEQYISWLSKAVRGDLGLSVLTGAD